MPRSFLCPGCGGTITTFLRRGERARCGACGVEAVVPEDAVEGPAGTAWVLSAPRSGPAPGATPPEPRAGRPPPFLSWSFAISGLFPLTAFLPHLTGSLALVCVLGVLSFVVWPWYLISVGVSMAVMSAGPPEAGPGAAARIVFFAGVAAALAEYPVYALLLARAWRWRDVRRTIGILIALHLCALLAGVLLCVVFFHPV
ncbi:MAG: hypothetical protein MUE73_07445 [Planctomycetes bacterium]|jgi:hypothetical protein|nr:hypothetical protein [Planctomycetota bacterium]